MTVRDIAEKTNGEIVIDNPDAQINAAYTSDLLSDVMGHCGDESALITIQNHINTIAVCTLAGIEAIVICHRRPVPEDMAEAARRENVAIIATPLSQFQASVALAELRASAK
jgi:hypothetical protein